MIGHFAELRTQFSSSSILTNIAGHTPPRTAITDALVDALYDVIEYVEPQKIIEIGAHEASFSIAIKKRMPHVAVFAYEANPYVYNFFKTHPAVVNSGVEYVLSAVSDEEGETTLFIPTSVAGVAKSLTNMIGSLNRLALPDTSDTSISVTATTLDIITKDTPGPLAVWIDVEGAVDRVLDGGKLAIQKTDVIMCELETAEVWKEQPLDGKILDRLMSLGFIPILCDCQKQFQYNVILLHERVQATPQLRRIIDQFPEKVGEIFAEFSRC